MIILELFGASVSLLLGLAIVYFIAIPAIAAVVIKISPFVIPIYDKYLRWLGL